MKKSAEAPKFSRKNFMISPKFQLKYIVIILLTIFSAGIIIGGGIYLTLMTVVNKNITDLASRNNFMAMIFSGVNNFLLIALPLVLLAVVLISIYVTHKIAGPEYRIKRVLESMGWGDFAVPVTLRKGDELQLLADKIKEVNRSLSFMIKEQKIMVKKLYSKHASLLKEVKKAKPSRIKLASLAVDLSETSRKLKEDFESIKILDV